ncbi:hybrid sensor histidine kinase/response regulator [Sorangium sp. So ce726]|uniref:ATP-binding protein n=1 Tax=Sorangium sp. So ce726 TaxID=3133319 RepID=UPI003F610F00
MSTGWNILVVDDEEDVHTITQIALKRRLWRQRPFHLTSTRSAAQALATLRSPDCPSFNVALIDVVMETPTAGLELCRYIRANCPSSLRIVLRTGQPGSAFEDSVLNEYDIDYYLSKPEVTAEKLFAVIRACLRSSQDISTLMAFGRQLRNFTRALQSVTSVRDLLVFMDEALGFLEAKHDAGIVFVHDMRAAEPQGVDTSLRHGAAPPPVLAAIEAMFARGVPSFTLQRGDELGLPPNTALMSFSLPAQADLPTVQGGLYMAMSAGALSATASVDIASDARIFLENWVIAHSTLRLQQQVAADRILREKMYVERLEGIAHMVASMSHEINTPLGVATAANSMIQMLVRQLRSAEGAEAEGLDADLNEACALLSKNILRAHNLIKSFKQLSVGQLTDRRVKVDVTTVVRDCIDSLSPEFRAKKIEVTTTATAGEELTWDGFPGHLSQVLINLFQNSARYAYPDVQGGTIDVRVERVVDNRGIFLRIAVRDHGPGVAPAVRKRLFQPFVTTGIGQGGTGLGLAIVHNIVVNVLKGRIELEDPEGGGSRFVIELPAVVPLRDDEPSSEA